MKEVPANWRRMSDADKDKFLLSIKIDDCYCDNCVPVCACSAEYPLDEGECKNESIN